MMELADTLHLGCSGGIHESSSLSVPTMNDRLKIHYNAGIKDHLTKLGNE